MEIEKTRETSWKIQLKRKNECIELTSVEISGEVRSIKLKLIKEDNSLMAEMNKEEFFNFLSLITAFKDVVIGEDSMILEQIDMNIASQNEEEEQEELDEKVYPSESESPSILEKKDQLNPEEWDPW